MSEKETVKAEVEIKSHEAIDSEFSCAVAKIATHYKRKGTRVIYRFGRVDDKGNEVTEIVHGESISSLTSTDVKTGDRVHIEVVGEDREDVMCELLNQIDQRDKTLELVSTTLPSLLQRRAAREEEARKVAAADQQNEGVKPRHLHIVSMVPELEKQKKGHSAG